jgi:hypothetical protein
MPGLVVRVDRVQRVIPGLEDFAGGEVEVAAAILIPDGQVIPFENHGVGRGPPDLVVGGIQDLA